MISDGLDTLKNMAHDMNEVLFSINVLFLLSFCVANML
jgi:hypothetical protein